MARLRWPVLLVLVTALASAAVAARQAQPTTRDESRDRNLRSYTELLRSDIRLQKVALITELMSFTEAEDAAFVLGLALAA